MFVSCLEGNFRGTWNKRSWNTDTESDIANIMCVNELSSPVPPPPPPTSCISHTSEVLITYPPHRMAGKPLLLSCPVAFWAHHQSDAITVGHLPANHHLLQQSFCLYAQRYKGSAFRKMRMERMEGMRGGRRSGETETGSCASLCWTKQDYIKKKPHVSNTVYFQSFYFFTICFCNVKSLLLF